MIKYLLQLLKVKHFRLALTIASSLKYVVHHIHITTAYLHADLQEQILMRQIPGFELKDSRLVLKLHKSLYRLKQSAKLQNIGTFV